MIHINLEHTLREERSSGVFYERVFTSLFLVELYFFNLYNSNFETSETFGVVI